MGAPDYGDRYRAGSGTPLVLLHGLGATWRVWQPVMAALVAHHDVLAITLPGHLGAAPLRAAGPVTAGALTDALEETLDREGIGSAHIAGNSLGGWLALELARRGRASTVVSIAPIGLLTAAEIDRLSRQLRAQQRTAARIRPLGRVLAGTGPGRRLLFGTAVHRPAALSPECARQWLDAFVGCGSFDTILDGLCANPPVPLPPDLGCPVCVAWPDKDRTTPAHPYADRFAAALPGARHVRVPSAGHIPMSDAPQQVAAIILESAREPSRPVTGH